MRIDQGELLYEWVTRYLSALAQSKHDPLNLGRQRPYRVVRRELSVFEEVER